MTMTGHESSPGPPRALGIDFGTVRIGVAVTDQLGMLAHPVETVDGRDQSAAIARLAALACHHAAATVVIGIPLLADGSEGATAARVREFAARLAAALPPETAITFQDERFSSREAREKLDAAGRRAKDHQPVLDQAAAVHILQDWLNEQSGPAAFLLPDPDA